VFAIPSQSHQPGLNRAARADKQEMENFHDNTAPDDHGRVFDHPDVWYSLRRLGCRPWNGWNQVAATAAARAYAAEGKCYPVNGPCPAPRGTAHPYKSAHVHTTRQHKSH